MQDWKCPRARYWGYEYVGRGIVKNGTSIELFIGIVLHDALAALGALTKEGLPIDINAIARAAYDQIYAELAPPETVEGDAIDYAEEQGTLVEGIIRGFYKHVWPILMAQYPTIVAVEAEMSYALGDGFKFMTKPDLLVEDFAGDIVYLEYKSTSWKKESWVNSWDTAVQLHSSVKATEQTLGRTVAGVQIVGMYKGYESYGKQSSPFCYAYKKAGNPPFTQDQIDYKYRAGFRRTPTWKMAGGLAKWIDDMPDNILADQFPLTPVIYPNDDLVQAFFRQRLAREQIIAATPATEERVLDEVFPQRFDQCVPSFGYPCQYKKLCHGFVDNPLEEGFVLREPHHDEERRQFNLA